MRVAVKAPGKANRIAARSLSQPRNLGSRPFRLRLFRPSDPFPTLKSQILNPSAPSRGLNRKSKIVGKADLLRLTLACKGLRLAVVIEKTPHKGAGVF